jgi:hypothetical protein
MQEVVLNTHEESTAADNHEESIPESIKGTYTHQNLPESRQQTTEGIHIINRALGSVTRSDHNQETTPVMYASNNVRTQEDTPVSYTSNSIINSVSRRTITARSWKKLELSWTYTSPCTYCEYVHLRDATAGQRSKCCLNGKALREPFPQLEELPRKMLHYAIRIEFYIWAGIQ